VGYQTLISERAGAVATITLNRPEARNALDFVMRRELAAVLDEIEADEAARVVILTGAGGHFCSGGDVKTMRARRHTAAEGRARVESLNRMVRRLVDFPRPTIAMVDGYAVGAGSNLALCCDLIVASDRAKFGELFWKIGLVPDGGGTWLLSRVIGDHAVQDHPLAALPQIVFQFHDQRHKWPLRPSIEWSECTKPRVDCQARRTHIQARRPRFRLTAGAPTHYFANACVKSEGECCLAKIGGGCHQHRIRTRR